MNVQHLTVYFDPQRELLDGRGFCVDVDHADFEGEREPGDIGYRFSSHKDAGEFVASFLKDSRDREQQLQDLASPDAALCMPAAERESQIAALVEELKRAA